MAKKDLTPLQENCSILFFKTLLKAKFNLSDAGYAKLDKEAFQKPGGIYPLGNSKKDREWNEGAAKKQLFIIFEALEPNNLIVLNGRRKLSSLIFA